MEIVIGDGDYTGMRWLRHGFRKNLCLWLASAIAVLPAEAFSIEPDRDEHMLASSVTGPIGEEGTAGQLLKTATPTPGLIPGENSIWEGLLLDFAIQRDPKMSKLLRKQFGLKTFTVSNVAVLNGLGAGQSIPFLVAPNQTLFARQILGVITTGVSFAGLGVQTWLNRKYRREAERCLDSLKGRIRHVIHRLCQGENPELVRLELDEMVGPQAGREFISLWTTVYQPKETEQRELLEIPSPENRSAEPGIKPSIQESSQF
jgi:hypothetical protein